MEITVTATDANRRFSEILRGVREGKSYVITSRGRPVASLRAPLAAAQLSPARRKAWEALKKRLDSQPALNLPHISRDQMHRR